MCFSLRKTPCLRLRRNPPRLVGSRLALLPLGHVMTRQGLILEPAGLSQSRLRVTLASVRLTELIYKVCPASRPLFDPKAPRCEFEGWFGQPEASTSSQRFRLYPRVAEVQEEVAARAESLARRSKPLSRMLPARARSFSVADDTIFSASQPINSAFAQLTGPNTLATKRWGSVSFNDMERLERLFLNQLEVTSSSLWLMSGILAMLKQDRFHPSDPSLFNAALSYVSAALSRQARSSAAATGFIRAKRRESLLAHATLLVPESQRRSLMTSPGNSSGLFDSGLLAEVVAQVHSSSQISSNLALCSDRILTCRIKSIRSPAKVGLVVTDLITSPVVSWEGWETHPPPPPPQHRGSAVILCSTTGVVRPLCSCGDLLLSSARIVYVLVDGDWNTFSSG